MQERKKISFTLDSEFFLELTVLTGFNSVRDDLTETEKEILDLAHHEMQTALEETLTEDEINSLIQKRETWIN